MTSSAFFASSIRLIGKHMPIETSESSSSSNHAQLYVICDKIASFHCWGIFRIRTSRHSFFPFTREPESEREREGELFFLPMDFRSGSRGRTMIYYHSLNFISDQNYRVTILKKLKCHVMRNVGSLFLRCVERPSVGAIGRSIKGLPCMYTGGCACVSVSARLYKNIMS